MPARPPPIDRPVLRFAPSPNGELHLGHALSALVGFELARRHGGRFLLRIEDIDPERSRSEHVEGIYRDLAWLGIVWEEPVLAQSQHLADYQAAAGRLSALGLLYPCFATRSEIAAAARHGAVDPDGAPIYPGLHRGLDPAEVARRRSRGEPHVMRLDVSRAIAFANRRLADVPLAFQEVDARGPRRVLADPARWGDVVLQRKDTPTSYHLAVVVDDARQGVTWVTRGLDLYPATDIHRLLQVLLDLPEPIYWHHPLITDASGRKLAKSASDTSLRELRDRGTTPAEIRRLIDLDGVLAGAA